MAPDVNRFRELSREFKRAVTRLQETCGADDTDIVRDARIQRFEFSFELAWKTLRAGLQTLGLEANSPRQAFKDAFTQGLIQSPEEGDAWLSMLEDRNLTSHTYKNDLALRIAESIRVRYAPLLQELSGKLEHWSPP